MYSQADALHGQLAQHIRETILANFKSVRFLWYCLQRSA